MGRGISAFARCATAVLLVAGTLVAQGASPSPVGARSPDCPPPPVTIEKLIQLGAGSGAADGLACYGGRRLTFRAYVLRPTDGDTGVNATVIAPRWLDSTFGSVVALGTGPYDPRRPVRVVPWADAYVPPALGRCYPGDYATCPFRWYWGRWATVTAHFDGPVARTCRIDWQARGAGQTKRDAVAACRTKLIVLSVGPIEPPATATLGLLAEIPAGPPTAPLSVAILALGSLLVAGRFTSRRR